MKSISKVWSMTVFAILISYSATLKAELPWSQQQPHAQSPLYKYLKKFSPPAKKRKSAGKITQCANFEGDWFGTCVNSDGRSWSRKEDLEQVDCYLYGLAPGLPNATQTNANTGRRSYSMTSLFWHWIRSGTAVEIRSRLAGRFFGYHPDQGDINIDWFGHKKEIAEIQNDKLIITGHVQYFNESGQTIEPNDGDNLDYVCTMARDQTKGNIK
jgi:hypothetical protein